MSYLSRVYRQRNAHTPDEMQQPFFSKRNDITKSSSQSNAFFQAKIAVNAPGDKYEKEADNAANAVVNNKTAIPAVLQKNISSIQQLSSDPEKEKLKKIHKKEDLLKEEEKEKKNLTVQTKQEGNATTASSQVSSKIESSAGKGNPMPAKTSREMSTSFGVDFSDVRLHNDSEAAGMNKELQAHAFTHGNDIYFNSGKYNPENSEGKLLLAHELTHVVQQNGGGVHRQCKDCETEAGKDKEPLIQNLSATAGVQSPVQRVRIENGRKKFDCPDLAGDSKLEACLNDEDRLSPLETGASVIKIQKGLEKDGMDLGKDGTNGVYGADTGNAVMAFKRKHNLGSTQFPDVGPGTTAKLDELCATKLPVPKTPKPKSPEPELPGKCGPGTANPFCLPIPATDAPCQPFKDIESAEVLRNSMSVAIPLGAASDTLCTEVKPVWETYFAATSTPFAFSNTSSCVVNAAKTDQQASDEANRIAKGHLEDILANLPITLRGVTPSPFPFPGRPLAERRMPLEDAIPLKIRSFLHHPSIFYNDKHNAAANIAGGTGIKGEGSDIFGDDDRVVGGTVIIELSAIDPTSGRMIGQVRWQPHIHVKDTVDFCPGNLTNSIILREFTVPMSKLEAMGLTRDVPFTIDYDLDVQQANFTVLPIFGPTPP